MQRAIFGLTWELGEGATELKSAGRREESQRGQHSSSGGDLESLPSHFQTDCDSQRSEEDVVLGGRFLWV